MLNRSLLIKLLIDALEYFTNLLKWSSLLTAICLKMNLKIESQEFVFFTKGDDVAIINKVMQYVQNNETTKKLKNINKDHDNNELLISDLKVLDRAYPKSISNSLS
jgi:hypothetical protein